ncbi:MAG TPA: divergent PAP2 family protein [Anaerolineaceae bacterium]|nr:divergent PAP2 family protein [Anaerolineaceae bacterium]HQN68697.1 divergent PAP2 family protein [Anaerolineaceae bacterium]
MSFFRSPIALSAFGALILAQLIKTPIHYLRHKKWDWSLIISSGSMPSSHSALMSAVTTSIGLYHGWDHPTFFLGVAATMIVVYDATGVRRQAGLHAERINTIIREALAHRNLPEDEVKFLREVIGHSPAEALIGLLFGIVIAILIWLIFPA